jgi:hydrogenase maturation factor
MGALEYEIDARFALGPRYAHIKRNEIDHATKVLQQAARGESVAEVREILQNFPHLVAFQGTLAKILNRDLFDPFIQRIYWLGGQELQQAYDNTKTADILLDYYRKMNFLPEYMQLLEETVTPPVILHHNYQVTTIAPLDSGKVESILPAINNCLVRPASVLKVNEDNAEVETVILKQQGGYSFIPNRETVRINQDSFTELKSGQSVALHWGEAVIPIDSQQREQLEYWTGEVVSLL